MNKNNKNTKNSSSKNMKSNINNNFKNSVRTTSANNTATNKRASTQTVAKRSVKQLPKVERSPIVDSPISTSRDKTYIVLVWQSRSAGIIRRIMEVPGTQLTRTLDDIRMQKKAFSFYEKR